MHAIKSAAAILGLTAFALAGCGSESAMSGKTTMKATLSAAQEVPATASQGSGTGTFNYDPTTKLLQYSVSYSGLTGPATAAHIHGPAAMGANAGVMVPFQNVASSPITGSATLNADQEKALLSGQTYVNVHTAAHPGGEIRGQIVK